MLASSVGGLFAWFVELVVVVSGGRLSPFAFGLVVASVGCDFAMVDWSDFI